MEVPRERFRRTAAGAGTVIALAAVASVAAAELSGATGPTARPNPIALNDARHFPASGASGLSRAPVIVRVSGGFDWADAAAGVVAGLGLTLVGLGATRELGRRWPATHAGQRKEG
jgi:hypothetical protein